MQSVTLQSHSLLAKAELIRAKERALRGKIKLPHNVLASYIARELLLYFIVAFMFFFLLFFVNQILLMAERVLQKRVPIWDVLRLIAYALPSIVAQAAPFATIVGFLMCLGRLMTDNEILILRASGKSYGLLLFLVLSLGIGISAASFAVNDYLLPLGLSSYNKLTRQIILSNPAVELESNSIKKTNDTTLVIGTVEGKSVSDLLFFDVDADQNSRIIVAGATQVVTPSDKNVMMQLDMEDVLVVSLDPENREDYDVIKSGAVSMNLFSSSIMPASPTRNPAEYPALDLREEIKAMKTRKGVTDNQINIYELEFFKKFSLPFASIFFAFLSLPLALAFGKHNGQTIGLIIGIVLSFVYWAMLIVGQTLSMRNGVNSAITMWLPDALMGTLGFIFFAGMKRQ
jgi:lipopolysaccharide export system permease protein